MIGSFQMPMPSERATTRLERTIGVVLRDGVGTEWGRSGDGPQSDLIGVSDWPERTIEPQRPPQPVGTRGGPRHPEPLAVNLVRLRRIHADVAVPIVRACLFERHPLMPAV